jgi:hypothetical protein
LTSALDATAVGLHASVKRSGDLLWLGESLCALRSLRDSEYIFNTTFLGGSSYLGWRTEQ